MLHLIPGQQKKKKTPLICQMIEKRALLSPFNALPGSYKALFSRKMRETKPAIFMPPGAEQTSFTRETFHVNKKRRERSTSSSVVR